MHQPQTTKRHSVFYDYEIHPFRRPPEMDGEARQHDVLIVGAGPVGLVLALLLSRAGVASLVVEAEAQVSHGSRAVALTRRSVEILQQAGVEKRFVENGLFWTRGSSFYRGREVFRMSLPDDPDDRFGPILNNAQQHWEEFLVDAVNADPRIELRWQTRFLRLEQDDDTVTAFLDTPEGEYCTRSRWLVATDGGRSEVRRCLGLRMEGASYPGKFVITDFLAPDFGDRTERRCYFDPEWNPGNNVLVHRQPHGVWRFDYRLPEGETAEEALAPETIERRTRQIMEMVGHVVDWKLDWATVYSPNTKTLPEYRHGRVLFAGDAAHLLPIFGIRGANTGLQDAENLGWKLAAVVKGEAGTDLLDSYSLERVAAAREICEEAGKSTRLMDPPSHGYRVMRQALLSLSLENEFCRELLHWRTSRPHDYAHSPLNITDDDDADFEAGIAKGSVARNVRLGDDDYLFDHFAYRRQLLVFHDPRAETPPPDLAGLGSGHGLRILALGAELPGADLHLGRNFEGLAAKYGIAGTGTYLLRPDMHVAGRWQGFPADRIVEALLPRKHAA